MKQDQLVVDMDRLFKQVVEEAGKNDNRTKQNYRDLNITRPSSRQSRQQHHAMMANIGSITGSALASPISPVSTSPQSPLRSFSSSPVFNPTKAKMVAR